MATIKSLGPLPVSARGVTAGAAMVLLMLMAGCDKKPGGQVVAVVDSEEITQSELRAEAEAAGVAATQDMQTYAPQMLQRVIERNLLAGYAREQGLDRGPDYVARRRQLEQTLLANLALRKAASQAGPATPADVQAFIRQNPAVFARRQRLVLDQIRIASPTDSKQVKVLADLGSIDAIEARLKADKIQYARGNAGMDTGKVESIVAKQVTALPNGQVFDVSTNGVTYISAITDRTLVPTAASEWTKPAAEAMQRERVQKSLVDTMKKLRADAKIDYDPAYRPATAK